MFIGTRRPAAWSRAADEMLSRCSGCIAITSSRAERRRTLFDEAIVDILKLGPGIAGRARHAAGLRSAPPAAEASASPLTLRQLLTEQGVSILGLILEPRPIHPNATPLPLLQVEPDLPTEGGSAAADRAERCAIHLAFRARMAAARISLPKAALAAALRTLHRERRACLQALREKIAARRAMRAHERVARNFRLAAALTARGVPPRPLFEMSQDTDARVKAAILNKLG